MRIPKLLLVIAYLIGTSLLADAQELTQVIRGQVMDHESQSPLAYATVAIISKDSLMGTITDESGFFRFTGIPVGRYDLKVSHVGYETRVVPELLVTTGKENVLSVRLKERIAEL